MYRHPAVAENIKRLQSMGITIIPPEEAEDKAKVAHNDAIIEAVIHRLSRQDLSGRKVLITAGPTRSYMDAIRYLTNPSTGTMGIALAQDAVSRGADVTLITGPIELPAGAIGLRMSKVTTTNEMLDAVLSELKTGSYDLLIMAAAPLDFDFASTSDGKISSDSPLSLRLIPLPKISLEARKNSPQVFMIGFKAEYGLPREELFKRAKDRLTASGMDLIVANDLSQQGAGFGPETNEAYVLDGNGLIEHLAKAPKREIARKILDIYLSRRGSHA